MFKCRLEEHIKQVHTNKTVECDACAPPRLFKYQKNLLRAYIMEPDNLGGIIPPRCYIMDPFTRGDDPT